MAQAAASPDHKKPGARGVARINGHPATAAPEPPDAVNVDGDPSPEREPDLPSDLPSGRLIELRRRLLATAHNLHVVGLAAPAEIIRANMRHLKAIADELAEEGR